jgi:hypothetical protein
VTGEVTIPARFNGPSGSANGGYACGVVAAAVGPSATVRLTAPPPLDVPLMRRRDSDGVVRLLHADTPIAEGRPGAPAVAVPDPPPLERAAQAAESYMGRDPERHPYPTCFVCGPLRRADGLSIFPGPTGEDGRLACPWTPAADLARDGVVDPVFVWAVLDCPSGIACMPPGAPTVLASMTAAVQAPVHPGRPYVVTAWPIGSEGRKHRAASAVHDRDGRCVAVAEALWITLRADA